MSNNSKDKQHSKPSLARRLWNKAYEGIADACYIWWLELKNTIKQFHRHGDSMKILSITFRIRQYISVHGTS